MTVLGAGAFGQVTLVKHGGRHYALKTLAKMHIVQTGLTARTSRRAPPVLPKPCHSGCSHHGLFMQGAARRY